MLDNQLFSQVRHNWCNRYRPILARLSEQAFLGTEVTTAVNGDIAIFRFGQFGLKIACSRPFWVAFWAHFPQVISLIVLTSKRSVLGRTIKREYRRRGSSWALERQEKRTVHDSTEQARKDHKKVIGYISPVWAETPVEVS